MKYNKLGNTDIDVSLICLGTMTWGQQNNQTEGFEQMDYALEAGVNFFDTAEMYPVPATEETCADTERVIGNWFEKSGNRDKVILASKIAGTGEYTAHIRTTGFRSDAIARQHPASSNFLAGAKLIPNPRLAPGRTTEAVFDFPRNIMSSSLLTSRWSALTAFC